MNNGNIPHITDPFYLLAKAGKANILPITLRAVLFCSSVPGNHDDVTASLHAQCQDRETEESVWNSDIYNLITTIILV